MLLYTKEKMNLVVGDTIRLDLKENQGYMYVTLGTLTQAILLCDKYRGDPNVLNEVLDLPYDHSALISELKYILPTPLNMLIPFYNLIDDSEVFLSVDNLEESLGVLCILSRHFDFHKMATIDKSIRNTVTYSKSILVDFEMNFRDIKRELGLTNYTPEPTVIYAQQQFNKQEEMPKQNEVKAPVLKVVEPVEEIKKNKPEVGDDGLIEVEDDTDELMDLIFNGIDLTPPDKKESPTTKEKINPYTPGGIIEESEEYVSGVDQLLSHFSRSMPKMKEEQKEDKPVVSMKEYKENKSSEENVKVKEEPKEEEQLDEAELIVPEEKEVPRIKDNTFDVYEEPDEEVVEEDYDQSDEDSFLDSVMSYGL